MTTRDARGRFTRPRHRADRDGKLSRAMHSADQDVCPRCRPESYAEHAARHRSDRITPYRYGRQITLSRAELGIPDTSPTNDTTRHPPMTRHVTGG